MEEGNNRSDSFILKSISGLENMEVLHLARPAEEVQDMVNAPAHNLLDVMPELQPAAGVSGSRARYCSMDLPDGGEEDLVLEHEHGELNLLGVMRHGHAQYDVIPAS
jgi:hypothetical protein